MTSLPEQARGENGLQWLMSYVRRSRSELRMTEGAWGGFAERLARLLDGGVPMLAALTFLERSGTRPQRLLSTYVRQGLETGKKLSDLVREVDAPLLMVSLLEVSEYNGDVAGNLKRASFSCRERDIWRKERRQAMLYPALLTMLVLILTGFLFEIVIPRFSELYEGMGVKVGVAPRMMFALARHDLLLLGVLLLSICGGVLLMRTRRDRFPLLGRLMKLERSHCLAVSLGVLLDGGMPLLQSLELQLNMSVPLDHKAIAQRVRDSVLQGDSLSVSLQREAIEEELVLAVQVAEATGDLGRALLASAKDMAERRKRMMDMLLKLMEPLLLLVVGGGIGLVALLLFLPMLDMLQSI